MKALRLVLTVLFHSLRALGRSRSDLLLENVALRQQINALTQAKPLPRLQPEERMLWVALQASASRRIRALYAAENCRRLAFATTSTVVPLAAPPATPPVALRA
ncbi:MAG TPA: hypothetical protein VKM54_05440, partial [Myxococcota bacterium]|nr:hypothetical protein [Myxococcota bacterium]